MKRGHLLGYAPASPARLVWLPSTRLAASLCPPGLPQPLCAVFLGAASTDCQVALEKGPQQERRARESKAGCGLSPPLLQGLPRKAPLFSGSHPFIKQGPLSLSPRLASLGASLAFIGPRSISEPVPLSKYRVLILLVLECLASPAEEAGNSVTG